jgi:hypothetical protein
MPYFKSLTELVLINNAGSMANNHRVLSTDNLKKPELQINISMPEEKMASMLGFVRFFAQAYTPLLKHFRTRWNYPAFRTSHNWR